MAGDSFLREVSEQLLNIKRAGLYRELKVINSPAEPSVIIDNKPYLVFCSNNYLGLANDRRVKEAAIETINKYGLGSGASRVICGNSSPHQRLEEELARFKGVRDAIIFPTGYMANIGVISSVAERGDTLIIDRLSHASIVDGCRLSQAKLQVYPHNDLDALESVLNRSRKFRRRLIVTESIFSMDGDIAPLPQLVELAKKHEALLMVDEAHATGVLGEHGRGAAELFGQEAGLDISMGTLSKAVGSLGGFVAGDERLINYLRQRARSFIYTTALPPAVCAVAICALRIIDAEPKLRERLWQNVAYLRSGLIKLGFDTMNSQTQIIPVLLKDESRVMSASNYLFERGILVPGIRPPTVPKGQCRLRICLSASHNQEQLKHLLDALRGI
jgi:8-amino-7-oxononanoate synthase